MKIIISYLLTEKRRTFTIILTVMIMVGAMSCFGNLIYGVKNSHSEYERQKNGHYEYVFSTSDSGYNIDDKINDSYHCHIGITQFIASTEEPLPIQLLAIDDGFFEMNKMELEEGNMPEHSDEVIVESWVLTNLRESANIGDTIIFDDKTYTISGILKNTFFKSRGEMNVFSTNIEHRDSEAYIDFKNKKNLVEQMERFSEENNINKKSIKVNWDVVESEVGAASSINDIIVWLKALPSNENTIILLWCCLSVFMIYSIYHLSVFKREKDYGILKSLGISRGRLFCITFFELFILYIIGFFPGVIIGNWITKKIYIKSLHGFLNSAISLEDYQVNSRAIRLGFMVTILLFLMVTAFMIRTIYNKQSVDLIKKNTELVKSRKTISLNKKNIVYKIASRFVTVRKEVFIFIIISLSIGNILFLTAQYTIGQIKKQNILEIKSDTGMEADYKVSIENSDLLHGISESEANAVKKIQGIKNAFFYRYSLGSVKLDSDKYVNKHYFDPENNSKRIQEMTGGICTKEIDGNYSLRTNLWGYDRSVLKGLKNYLIEGNIDYDDIKDNKKVIVRLSMSGDGSYNNVDIHPGDIIEIRVPQKQYYDEKNILKFENDEWYTNHAVEVAATVQVIPSSNPYFIDDAGIDIVMDNGTFSNLTGILDYNQAEIIKKQNANGEKMSSRMTEITSKIKGCAFVDHTVEVERVKIHAKEQILTFGIIAIVFILMGMLYVVNCTGYLVRIREKEIGVLRAIGLSDVGLRKMLAYEAFLYSFTSFIFTVGVTVLLQGWIYFFLKKIKFYYDVAFQIHWELMIALCLINSILCVLIMQLAANHILKKKQIGIIKSI